MRRAHLGIDIGTSKTAAVLVDDSGGSVAANSHAHAADLPAGPGRSEQDPRALLASVWAAVGGLPAESRRAATSVGLTGQMHGVVLLDAAGEPVGPLVTWQDGRCAEGNFLAGLNARTGAALRAALRTGYGCATLAWYASQGGLPRGAAAAATIHDWIAARLCAMSRPVTDPTDAASWGLFDLSARDWDLRAVAAAGIPPELLPPVVPCGQRLGHVSPAAAAMLGVPAGIPVAAAIGDNQASLLATLRNPESDLALTLGTGGQLSAVQPSDAPARASSPDASWEYRPYPGGRLLAVAASLCGGSAWAWLAQTLRRWQADLGQQEVSVDEIFLRLNALASADTGGISVHPHFLGERHDPARRASIDGITLDNMSLGGLACALAEGICANLRDMLPAELREGRACIVASGNALERNPALRRAAEAVFGLPVHLGGQKEAAAVGAARNAMGTIGEET